ncbi:MAG: hypothetical protein IKR27_08125 [Lachnospiraceae bacterium]|nr:hypothetical protein [Lachnospiraceae bacterium]
MYRMKRFIFDIIVFVMIVSLFWESCVAKTDTVYNDIFFDDELFVDIDDNNSKASTVITLNKYYSEYNPTKFNATTTPSEGTYTDEIQYRMNCYGYAFCNILFGHAYIDQHGGYKQEPGEFAKTSDKGLTVNNVVLYNSSQTMNNVFNNMQLDASRLGYTLTQYHPSSSTVSQYGTSSRLIAVVTGYKDYHFYMQHNDGTWSHKPGSLGVTNKSLSDNSTILTNSNIISLARSGQYSGGQLCFYIITKDSVIDKPHSSRCCNTWPCTHSQNSLFYMEKAGDHMKTSASISIGNKSGRFDFSNDHDYYYFVPTSTRTYTFTTTNYSSADIDCRVYDENGGSIYNAVNTGAVNFSISLTVGKRYYFDIYNYSKTTITYTFSIS